MERLTEKITNSETGNVLAYRLKREVDRIKAMQKLGKYEDAEEQGLLKNFIVDVGTKVWTITNPANYSLGRYAETVLKQPQEKKVQSITISKNGILYHVKDRTYGTFDIGKTIFLTKEEAEQALAEMKGV